MKTKASRRPFSDPFDELSYEQFEREVLEALEHGTTKCASRMTCLAAPGRWRAGEAAATAICAEPAKLHDHLQNRRVCVFAGRPWSACR